VTQIDLFRTAAFEVMDQLRGVVSAISFYGDAGDLLVKDQSCATGVVLSLEVSHADLARGSRYEVIERLVAKAYAQALPYEY